MIALTPSGVEFNLVTLGPIRGEAPLNTEVKLLNNDS